MAGPLGAALSFAETRFATLPVANIGLGVPLYQLSIRNPGQNATLVPGSQYTFPMSPQAVRKETTQLNTIYDVQGTAAQYGVARLVDMWGQTPPTYTLRGTTGWKLHSLDHFALTGKQSITKIQSILSDFNAKNQTLMVQQAQEFYTLEFYDYWMNEFWQVVPVGPQGVDQAADRPLVATYTFRLAAVKAVKSPISIAAADALTVLFSAGAQQIQIANSSITQKLAAY